MKDSKIYRLVEKIIPNVVLLVFLTVSCSVCGIEMPNIPTAADATATYLANPHPGVPDSGGSVISGPDGSTLNVDEGALPDTTGVMLEVLPPDDLPWEETPFEPSGPLYRLILGEARQQGGMTMTVPLPDPTDPSRRFVYAAWVQPDVGEPSLVGALVRDRQVTFPIIGAGKYRLIKTLHFEELAKIFDEKEPLSVPSYRQVTSSWCSPTALTDLAGYHQGAWPVGGFGSKWGESSNWFLAGKAGQPFNTGYFFHWLLEAGGYNAPADVKESFVDGNAIVLIWNFKAFQIDPAAFNSLPFYFSEYYIQSRLEYAEELYIVFRSFVEGNLWGPINDRRPVAWGSSLAVHSRVITGSDGTNFYYNDPSSGSWNQTKSWETYHMEIITSLMAEKTEIIDTVIFAAEPRPADQRRAVLWLLPWTDNAHEGSIILRQGAEGTPAAYWRWDGTDNRNFGYYYQDLTGGLPTDPILDVAFRAETHQDVVEFGYALRSISDGNYAYSLLPELFGENGKVEVGLQSQLISVDSGQRSDFFPAGSFRIATLEPGLYLLKFTLSQANIVQDVKYVYFRVAPHGVLPFPDFEVLAPAFCRKGPGSLYEIVTGFNAGQELGLLGFNPERTWGKFEATLNAITFQCWVSLDMMEIPDGLEAPILQAPPLPTASPTVPACSQYTTPQTCAQHAECTWDRLSGAGYCKPK